ncbi:MAG: c-type cytochrome [candidate division Zixibacteria bacterium]|nr:c-type cytochrome [candidate division Zixibacteria bacterium]
MGMLSGCSSDPGSLTVVITYEGTSIPSPKVILVDTDVPTCGAIIRKENIIVNSENRGLKNVVFRLEGEIEGKETPLDVTISNEGCVFVPHVAVAVIGSKINIRNDDPVFHTTNTNLNGKSLFNIPLLVGQPPPPPRPIKEAGLIEVSCAVHNWMKGYIFVHTNPYVAVTDESGKLSMTGMPPGKYSYVAWHEEFGEQTGEVEINEDGVTSLKLEFGGVSQPKAVNESEDISLIASLGELPLGLDKYMVRIPDDNSLDGASGAKKVELGRHLYFDTRLSKDNSISCASCHDPKKGWGDGEQFSTGVGGAKGGMNAPTIINRVFSTLQFWDGRSKSLEDQALGPIQNPIEMALTLDEAVSKISQVEGYKQLFKESFGDEQVTADRIGKAIASFERTIVSGNSPFDKYESGDKTAMSPSAISGWGIFRDNKKGNCTSCHAGFNFTDEAYHNIGVGTEKPDWEKDYSGRFAVTQDTKDKGAFKTPTLRDIAESTPYMHDGSVKTLEEVIEIYAVGGVKNEYLDPKMKKLKLTDQDKNDLVAFLKALSGDDINVVAPTQLK